MHVGWEEERKGGNILTSRLHKCSLQQYDRQLMAHDYTGKHKRKQQGEKKGG